MGPCLPPCGRLGWRFLRSLAGRPLKRTLRRAVGGVGAVEGAGGADGGCEGEGGRAEGERGGVGEAVVGRAAVGCDEFFVAEIADELLLGEFPEVVPGVEGAAGEIEGEDGEEGGGGDGEIDVAAGEAGGR